jgi:hypothetical protein
MAKARVLTVKQPWAWAIVFGGKDVENRNWATKHRGPLLIHAGMAFERDGYPTVARLSATRPPDPGAFQHGVILGVVELIDCVRDAGSVWAEPGAWHWCLRNPQTLEPPVVCTGKLGLWRPPEDLSW